MKEFDAAQMETYMDPEYRMDGREKSGAKKYIEHYYKTAKGFAGGQLSRHWKTRSIVQTGAMMNRDSTIRLCRWKIN